MLSSSLSLSVLLYKVRLPHFSRSSLEKLRIDSTNSRSPSEAKPSSLSWAASKSGLSLRRRVLENCLICGPSLNPYDLLNFCSISSNRSSVSIQLYRSPRGNGHREGRVKRCLGSCARDNEVDFSMNSVKAGD